MFEGKDTAVVQGIWGVVQSGYNEGMDRGAKNLILGLAIGAVAVLLAARLKQVREDSNADSLLEKLSDDLEALERNLKVARAREG